MRKFVMIFTIRTWHDSTPGLALLGAIAAIAAWAGLTAWAGDEVCRLAGITTASRVEAHRGPAESCSLRSALPHTLAPAVSAVQADSARTVTTAAPAEASARFAVVPDQELPASLSSAPLDPPPRFLVS